MAENEHSGHRARVRKKFLENGFDGFEPHEILEMYLFYAIPRKDTNALAHRLINCYKNIGGVCDAPINELMVEFSLSESAATLLKMLPEMSRLYKESKLSENNDIDLEHLGEIFQTKFLGRQSEAVALMLGDAKGKVIYYDIVSKGTISSTGMSLRKIVDLALKYNARTAFVAHNHPSGVALPSRGDLVSTKALKETLYNIGVNLIDHYIVTDDDFISLRDSGIAGDIFE